jgi:peptidoglycan/LPS O-acetylase OafA/YrhL
VLAGHSYVLTGQAGAEPVAALLGHVIDAGGLAVLVFFALSGFLIARSADRHGVGAYLAARVLRIYPAYLATVLLQSFVLGALLTTLPLVAYLAASATWTAPLRALAFSPPAGLPGVFAHNPVPGQVNGSLWTLRIEALCYAGMLLLSRAGMLARGRVLLPLGVAWLGMGVVLAARAGVGPGWAGELRWAAPMGCALQFMAGAALWAYRDRVRLSGAWAAAGLAAVLLLSRTPAGAVALHAALAYLVLYAGLAAPFRDRATRAVGDVSYGVYLGAFPIQQTIVALDPGIGPLPLIAYALPPVLVYAAASRRLVELPALRWRRGREGTGR